MHLHVCITFDKVSVKAYPSFKSKAREYCVSVNITPRFDKLSALIAKVDGVYK